MLSQRNGCRDFNTNNKVTRSWGRADNVIGDPTPGNARHRTNITSGTQLHAFV